MVSAPVSRMPPETALAGNGQSPAARRSPGLLAAGWFAAVGIAAIAYVLRLPTLRPS